MSYYNKTQVDAIVAGLSPAAHAHPQMTADYVGTVQELLGRATGDGQATHSAAGWRYRVLGASGDVILTDGAAFEGAESRVKLLGDGIEVDHVTQQTGSLRFGGGQTFVDTGITTSGIAERGVVGFTGVASGNIPEKGILRIDDEQIFYDGTTQNLNTFWLNRKARGVNGTSVAQHPSGTPVYLLTEAVGTFVPMASITSGSVAATQVVADRIVSGGHNWDTYVHVNNGIEAKLAMTLGDDDGLALGWLGVGLVRFGPDPAGCAVRATSFNVVSAREAKEDVRDFSGAIDLLRRTRLAWFRYTGEEDSSPLRVGIIAEDAPTEISGEAHDRMDTVNLAGIVAAAVQELLGRERLIESLQGA
jgi:hypothetical protein